MRGREPTYAGRMAALATRHHKQDLIAPALAETGLRVVVADVDTDRFGTFTGEVPRSGGALEVAERKARAAIACSGLDAGLASEGSFAPHPAAPFLTADVEIVLFADDRLGIVVHDHAISIAEAARCTVSADVSTEELRGFCRRVGFPDQALICRAGDGSTVGLTKAIVTLSELRRAVRAAADASSDRRAIVETDLRAHLCPARRPVIAKAAARLAARLSCRCPRCAAPGFGPAGSEPGLCCARCGMPTSQPAARIDRCPRCEHLVRHDLGGAASPDTCDSCNP